MAPKRDSSSVPDVFAGSEQLGCSNARLVFGLKGEGRTEDSCMDSDALAG